MDKGEEAEGTDTRTCIGVRSGGHALHIIIVTLKLKTFDLHNHPSFNHSNTSQVTLKPMLCNDAELWTTVVPIMGQDVEKVTDWGVTEWAEI